MTRLTVLLILATILSGPAQRGDTVIHVTIDVKPGDSPTTIEPNSQGMLPIAILATRDFDAKSVDPDSLLIGPTGTEAGPFRTMQEDVNRDGRTDLMMLVRYQELKAKCDTTMIRVTGKTDKGARIEGSEAVTTQGCLAAAGPSEQYSPFNGVAR